MLNLHSHYGKWSKIWSTQIIWSNFEPFDNLRCHEYYAWILLLWILRFLVEIKHLFQYWHCNYKLKIFKYTMKKRANLKCIHAGFIVQRAMVCWENCGLKSNKSLFSFTESLHFHKEQRNGCFVEMHATPLNKLIASMNKPMREFSRRLIAFICWCVLAHMQTIVLYKQLRSQR